MCATSVLLPQEKRVLINIFHTVILLFNKNFDLCGIYYKRDGVFQFIRRWKIHHSEIEYNKKDRNGHDLENGAYRYTYAFYFPELILNGSNNYS